MKVKGRYYTYIVTNQHRKVLYTGVTADLGRRLNEHRNNALFDGTCFTGRYQAFYCIWYEVHSTMKQAIAREKEIRGWRRSKKISLIEEQNPSWRFLNDDVF